MNTDGESRFKKCGERVRLIFFLTVMLIFGASIGAAEKTLAAAGPSILSATEIDYPPFCIVDAEGRANGFSVQLLQKALTAMGHDVTFRTGPWAEVRGWLEKGEIQALPLVGRTPEREDLFDFTFPYMTLHGAIVVQKDTSDIRELGDLSGRRVAVMKDDNAEEFLRREDRGIMIHTTATFEDALHELSEGRHDAVVIQRLVALRLLQKTGIANLRIIDWPIKGFRQDFCFAVKEGDRETLALLNEGLALVIADGTYRKLHAEWFAALELPSKRRILIGGDHNYPPFEYLDENGAPAGYNVDLTRAIAQEAGLEIEIRLGPWAEILQALASGEIDAIQGIFYSLKRDVSLDFTPPHTVNHYVSVARKGEGPPPATVGALAGKRIVVQQGDIMHDFAMENGLGGQVTAVDAQEVALKELAEGRHDYALVARLTALYLIKKHGWNNLSVGSHPFLSPEYCFAVTNNRKALLAQLSEGLKLIEETGEYRRIHKKWMGVYEEASPSPAVILQYVAMIAVPLLLIIVAFFLWSWALRKQVAIRTEALRRSESQFRVLVEGAPDAIFVQTETRFSYLNPAACRLFGAKESDELKGQPVRDRIHLSARDAARERIHEQREGKEISPVTEERWLRLDGSEVLVEVSAVPIDYEGRQSTLVFSQDISNRKQKEAERVRLMAAIEQASEIVFITDPTGIIQYVNPAFERVTGYPPAEAIGQNPRFLKSGKQDQAFYENLWSTITSGRTWEGRIVNRRKEGSLYTEDATISPVLDTSGRIVNYVAVKHDITEHLQLSAQYQQAQKMESVGRLAGGVAHDYNNMLSVILGYTEFAMEKVGTNDPLKADLKQIYDAAKRSTEITRQLLAFARKQTIAPRVLDLNDTVEGTLKMLRRLIGEEINLAWLPDADLWPVKIDPVQIDQILANLCINAVDAIAGVGKITIETDNVVFDETYCIDHAGFVPGEFTLLAVSDDGCGMDKETRDKIFEPFFTTKGVGQGTGLGLATVYGIIKQNDGFINVYSEPDKGTTFKIYLPRHSGKTKEIGRPKTEEIPKGRGETVLVVEDEISVLNLTEEMLEGLGYTVLTAKTPGEAMGWVEKHAGEIHLLLTDVVMPEMNGRDLSNHIQARRPRLKKLFMSGYTANVIAHRGVLDEGVHFIQKPFSIQDLAAAVRKVLDA